MVKSIDKCIELIVIHSANENPNSKEIENLLLQIKPYLSKQYGSKMYNQIEKLIAENLFETTIKVLKDLPNKKLSYRFIENIRKVSIIFLIIFTESALLYLGFDTYLNSKSCANWPTTKGIVLESEIYEVWGIVNKNTKHNEAHIKYKYSVNSKEYTSEKVSYRNIKKPTLVVKKYPKGKEIIVYYKPNNPKISVIETGFSNKSYLWFGMAVFVLILVFIFKKSDKDIED